MRLFPGVFDRIFCEERGCLGHCLYLLCRRYPACRKLPTAQCPPQEMKTVNPLYRRNRDLGVKRPCGRQAPHRSSQMPKVLTPSGWFSLGFYSDLLSFLPGSPCGLRNQQSIFTLGPGSVSPPCIFSSPTFQESRSSEVIPLFTYNETLKERIRDFWVGSGSILTAISERIEFKINPFLNVL